MHHHHQEENPDDHGHTHGVVDPNIATTERGIWAVKWSFLGLSVTAVLQLAVVLLTGSVALLADTIHNAGDALTAIPLWIAFLFARRRPTRTFTSGFGRVEDLAGVFIVLVILASAIIAGYESINRLIHPRDITYVWVVAAAGAIGFIGNEVVALFRIKVGREIKSAALIADGYHARVDGLTSLGVLLSAVVVALGFPLADPIVGLVITALILRIVWDSAKSVFTRMLGGVDPDITDEVAHLAGHVHGVLGVSDVRGRWLGHRLEVEIHLTVSPEITIREGHSLSSQVSHALQHEMPYLGNITIHTDPLGEEGIQSHRTSAHQHDGLPLHSH